MFLCVLQDALCGDGDGVGVDIASDAVSVEFQACERGGSAADERVEYGIAGFGEPLYEFGEPVE